MGKRMTAVKRRAQIAMLRSRDGADCWLCGEEMLFPEVRRIHPWLATIDHVYPLAMGGTNRSDNLKLAHLSCNTKRGTGSRIRSDPNGNPDHRFYVNGRRFRATRYWEMFKTLDADWMLA